jgi:hypothetical protein
LKILTQTVVPPTNSLQTLESRHTQVNVIVFHLVHQQGNLIKILCMPEQQQKQKQGNVEKKKVKPQRQ